MSMKFEWEVTLPERSRASLGQRKPQATITYTEGDTAGEYSVPKEVGKKLLVLQASEEELSSKTELVEVLLVVQNQLVWLRLIDLINRRDYSVEEMRKKLEQYGYWSKPIDEAIARAQENRYLNDERYAEVYIHSKLSAGWGKAKIERELKLRGIEPESLTAWPEAYFADDEYERALELAQRKTFHAKDPYAQCVRFLANRGFSQSVAHQVARTCTKSSPLT